MIKIFVFKDWLIYYYTNQITFIFLKFLKIIIVFAFVAVIVVERNGTAYMLRKIIISQNCLNICNVNYAVISICDFLLLLFCVSFPSWNVMCFAFVPVLPFYFALWPLFQHINNKYFNWIKMNYYCCCFSWCTCYRFRHQAVESTC